MIDINHTTKLGRYVAPQMGNCSIFSFVQPSKLNGGFDVLCSGSAGVVFSFGIQSGAYYASGDGLKDIGGAISNASQFFQFDIFQTGYNISSNNQQLLSVFPKASGTIEKLHIHGNGNDFSSKLNLILYGNPTNIQSLATSNLVVVPSLDNNISGIWVKNAGTTHARILSASLDFSNGNVLSGALPITIQSNSSGYIPFSGIYTATPLLQNAIFSCTTDSASIKEGITIYPTQYSGSGLFISWDTPRVVNNDSVIQLLEINNTGTVSANISPQFVQTAARTSESGYYLASGQSTFGGFGSSASAMTITGTTETPLSHFIPLGEYPFFANDSAASDSQANRFALRQSSLTGLPIYSVVASETSYSTPPSQNVGCRGLGYFLAKKLGHTFRAKSDIAVNYIDLPLRGNGDTYYYVSGINAIPGAYGDNGVNFSPNDYIGLYLYSGDEQLLLRNKWIRCSGNILNQGTSVFPRNPLADVNTPSWYNSSFSGVRFGFNDVLLKSGDIYTILISGSGDWMNSAVSGRRYVSWNSIWHSGDGGIKYGPQSIINGTGFCYSDVLFDRVLAMGSQYSDNGATEFGLGGSLTGYLGSGFAQFQRFTATENAQIKGFAIDVLAGDRNKNQTQSTGIVGVQTVITIYPASNDIGFPDLDNPISSGVLDHDSQLYRYGGPGVNEGSGAAIGFGRIGYKACEVMIPISLMVESGVNYWIGLSGINYPDTSFNGQYSTYNSLNWMFWGKHWWRQWLPFNDWGAQYFYGDGLNLNGHRFLTYNGNGDWYSGTMDEASWQLNYPTNRCDHWRINAKIFGVPSGQTNLPKKLFEIDNTFCFTLGYTGTMWECINLATLPKNEFLSSNYDYFKHQSHRSFSVLSQLPIALDAGQTASIEVLYTGVTPYTNYARLLIPELGYGEIISGYTEP